MQVEEFREVLRYTWIVLKLKGAQAHNRFLWCSKYGMLHELDNPHSALMSISKSEFKQWCADTGTEEISLDYVYVRPTHNDIEVDVTTGLLTSIPNNTLKDAALSCAAAALVEIRSGRHVTTIHPKGYTIGL